MTPFDVIYLTTDVKMSSADGNDRRDDNDIRLLSYFLQSWIKEISLFSSVKNN
jgi:hypothetical protein